MLLTGFAKPHLNAICFTHYTQWAAGIKHYEIYRKDDGNLPYQLIGTQSDTSFLDYDVPFTGGQFLYLIKAISNNGDAYSYSNTLELNQQPDVFVPNAFSPNGDGVNDLWRPTAIFVNQIDVWVFNHWGDNVFTTNSEQIYWDGTKNNKICESGIYTFKITYSDFNGGRFEKKGTITLLK
jgi:gliding motility-associated-like protein